MIDFQTCKSAALRAEEKTCQYCRYQFAAAQNLRLHSCILKPFPPETTFHVLNWRSATSKIAQAANSLTELQLFEMLVEENIAIEGIFPPLFRTRGNLIILNL